METAHDSLEIVNNLKKTIRMLRQMRKELMSIKQQEELRKALIEIVSDLKNMKKESSKELEKKLLDEKKKLDNILNKTSKGKKLNILIDNSKQRAAKEQAKSVKILKRS
jgi:hypothetical protein